MDANDSVLICFDGKCVLPFSRRAISKSKYLTALTGVTGFQGDQLVIRVYNKRENGPEPSSTARATWDTVYTSEVDMGAAIIMWNILEQNAPVRNIDLELVDFFGLALDEFDRDHCGEWNDNDPIDEMHDKLMDAIRYHNETSPRVDDSDRRESHRHAVYSPDEQTPTSPCSRPTVAPSSSAPSPPGVEPSNLPDIAKFHHQCEPQWVSVERNIALVEGKYRPFILQTNKYSDVQQVDGFVLHLPPLPPGYQWRDDLPDCIVDKIFATLGDHTPIDVLLDIRGPAQINLLRYGAALRGRPGGMSNHGDCLWSQPASQRTSDRKARYSRSRQSILFMFPVPFRHHCYQSYWCTLMICVFVPPVNQLVCPCHRQQQSSPTSGSCDEIDNLQSRLDKSFADLNVYPENRDIRVEFACSYQFIPCPSSRGELSGSPGKYPTLYFDPIQWKEHSDQEGVLLAPRDTTKKAIIPFVSKPRVHGILLRAELIASNDVDWEKEWSEWSACSVTIVTGNGVLMRGPTSWKHICDLNPKVYGSLPHGYMPYPQSNRIHCGMIPMCGLGSASLGSSPPALEYQGFSQPCYLSPKLGNWNGDVCFAFELPPESRVNTVARVNSMLVSQGDICYRSGFASTRRFV